MTIFVTSLVVCFRHEIYIAPSGVQKERIQPDDMFVTDMDENDLQGPAPERGLKKSQCTPLFFNAFRMRGAGACIHTHSQHAVMVTLLNKDTFRITHQEMIKVISLKDVHVFFSLRAFRGFLFDDLMILSSMIFF
jgi:ribulose-5-phosphate 4-epimerase/fuculose-1-phosphate aldolase